MSVEVISENNPGPLKLEYDITPRDLRKTEDPPSPRQDPNFRFKGYPEKHFEGSKHPIFGAGRDTTEVQGVKLSEIQGAEHHTRKNFFDTRNPKAYGSPKGLQYGSSALPENRTSPQPIRGSLLDMDRSKRDTASVISAEVHKFRQRQEEGAAEIRKLKQERLQAMMNAEAEKKYDMEMLKNYNPWGRPGGGAPLGADNKKKKFTESELEKVQPSPRPDRDFVEEYGDHTSWWGKPGAGAPLRTNSGKLKTEIKGSQDIRFLDTQKGRNVYDVEVRYRQEPSQRYNYSKELEKQIASKKLESQEARIRELKEELAMMQHDPYGRPGAGAPNKTMSAPAWLMKDEAERRALTKAQSNTENEYNPWGKGVGQPEYDKFGDTRRHPNTRRIEGVYTDNPKSPNRDELYSSGFNSYQGQGNTLNLANTRGGGGAPIMNERAEFGKQTRLPILMKRDEKGDTTFREDLPGLRRRPPPPTMDDEELRIYDPFGKGGAGAPVRDNRGNVVTTVFGNFNNASTYRKNSPRGEEDKRKGRDPNYIHELQNDSERYKQQRTSQDRALKYGAGDLATEIKRGQVGFPRRDPQTGMITNHHLASTDVTREKANVYSLKSDKTSQYHNDLKYAEEQRVREEKLEKLRERQEARHHGDSQNSFWGRPGGGAPIAQEHKKANLDQILYSPRREPVDYYAKSYSNGQGSNGNFVRTTVGSNHSNMFELPREQKRQRGQDYHLPKPFATEGTEVL